MVESNSEVQNFWQDFQEEFNSWAAEDQSMEVHTTSTTTITASTTSTYLGGLVFWTKPAATFRPAGTFRPPAVTIPTTTEIPPNDFNHVIQTSLEIKFCEAELEDNNPFCIWCEPLCDIHTIKLCENNWGSFVKSCCGLCDFQCDVECPVPLYVLTSLFSVVGRVF